MNELGYIWPRDSQVIRQEQAERASLLIEDIENNDMHHLDEDQLTVYVGYVDRESILDQSQRITYNHAKAKLQLALGAHLPTVIADFRNWQEKNERSIQQSRQRGFLSIVTSRLWALSTIQP